MLNVRVYEYLNDEDTATISGTITAVGGRYDDIKAIQWDDGAKSHVAEHWRGITWEYED
jgi:membrane-bound inhibitor of C-type lysozyme